jgi:hypothetical protein
VPIVIDFLKTLFCNVINLKAKNTLSHAEEQ